MKAKIRKIVSDPKVYIIMGIFAIWLFMDLFVVSKRDDLCMQAIYDREGGLIPWLTLFAKVWGGRLLANGILIELFLLPDFVIQVLNTAFMTLGLVYMHRYVTKWRKSDGSKEKFIMIAIGVSPLVMISTEILNDAVFWKAAMVVYSWGFVALLVALEPIIMAYSGIPQKKLRWWKVAILISAALYAGNFEQTSPLLLTFVVVLSIGMLVQKRKVPILNLVIALASATGMLLIFLLPGNGVRYRAGILELMPQFDSFRIVDKLFYSVNYSINAIAHYFSLLLCLIAVITLTLVVRNRKEKSIRFFAGLPALYFCIQHLYIISLETCEVKNQFSFFVAKFFKFTSYTTEATTIFFSEGISSFLAIFNILLLAGIIAFYSMPETEIITALFWSAAFCDVAILGFSPSVYVSGARVFNIAAMMLILVLFRLAYALWNSLNEAHLWKTW